MTQIESKAFEERQRSRRLSWRRAGGHSGQPWNQRTLGLAEVKEAHAAHGTLGRPLWTMEGAIFTDEFATARFKADVRREQGSMSRLLASFVEPAPFESPDKNRASQLDTFIGRVLEMYLNIAADLDTSENNR